MKFPQKNNFDILRLVAAFQVALFHGYTHFNIAGQNKVVDFLFQKIIIYFPGVPIFFAMSGFLIFATFDKKGDIKQYSKNRILRLYPGLWVAFLLTVCVLFLFGFLNWHNIFDKQIVIWIIGQLSFFQFYTPDILRGYGLENPNGSLWTIAIELQYYAFVPFVFFLFRKIGVNRNIILIALFMLSLIANVYIASFGNSGSTYAKLAGICLIPYLFYFLSGALIYINYQRLSPFLEGKIVIIGCAYFLFYLIFAQYLHFFNHFKYFYKTSLPNAINLLNTILLLWFVFSIAFSRRGAAEKLLHGNDISYGLYIYHAIVLIFFLQAHLSFTVNTMCLYLAISLILSLVSWKFVERPFLKLKT